MNSVTLGKQLQSWTSSLKLERSPTPETDSPLWLLYCPLFALPHPPSLQVLQTCVFSALVCTCTCGSQWLILRLFIITLYLTFLEHRLSMSLEFTILV